MKRKISHFTQKPLALLFAFLFSVAFANASFAQASEESAPKDDTLYRWVFKYNKGEVERIQTDATITLILPNGQNLALEVKTITAQTTKEVSEKGDAVVSEVSEKRSVTVNGNTQEVEQIHKSTYKVTKEGRYKELSSNKNEETDSTFNSEIVDKIIDILNTVPVPPKPLKIGESWTIELENTLMPGDKVNLKFTLMEKEMVGNVDALVVKGVVNIPLRANGQDVANAEMLYYIDVAKGN